MTRFEVGPWNHPNIDTHPGQTGVNSTISASISAWPVIHHYKGVTLQSKVHTSQWEKLP